MNKSKTTKIILISIMSAISTILMMIDFPLFFSPSFMKMDISELPALFISFYLGPLDAAAVIIVKVLLKCLFKPTSTAFIGEVINILAGLVYVVPCGIIYKKFHTKKGAKSSLVFSTIITSLVLVIINSNITFPMYGKIYGLDTNKIVSIASKVNPLVKDNLTLMIFSVLPFNIIKYSVISLITYLLYNRLNLFFKEHIK